MTIEHSIITDPNVHEPKGVTGASAGDVYIADGLGSGSWELNVPVGATTAPIGSPPRATGGGSVTWDRVQGWGQYQDASRTVGSPTQVLTAGVRTKLVCDGTFLTESHLPSDATLPLWDVATNKHVPIAEFDVYHLRISFAAENYGGATPYIDFELDIGGSIGDIYWDSIALRKGGAQQRCSFAFPVFTGSTYNANGGDIYLTYTGTGTCDIYSTDILIVRESKAYI